MERVFSRTAAAVSTIASSGFWASLLLLPCYVSAEELQEVIVTAQKREQSVQDVGVSVTALTAGDLQKTGFTDALELSHYVPAVQLVSASGGNYGSQLTIRGVAQSDFSPHQESPNSMYFDDVYVSTTNALSSQLFDTARIEALRGPQGTLFGRNSTGGLVNIITQKPTADLQGYVDVTGGEYNLARVEAVVSGPLSSNVRGRISLAIDRDSGYVDNALPNTGNLNTTHFNGGRGQLAVDFSDTFTALLSFTLTHDDDVEGFYGHFASYYDPNNNGRPTPLPANINYWGTCDGCDLQGYLQTYNGIGGIIPFYGFLRRTLEMPTLRLDWKLGSATLTSITNYTGFQFNYDEACSGNAPQVTCRDPYTQNLKQWSQELRLAGSTSRLDWVTGFYALGIQQHDTGSFFEPYYSGTPFAFNSHNVIYQKLTDFALFGQGEYLFSSKWRGTLGGRVTRDDKEFSSQAYYNELGNFVDSYTVYNPPLLVYDFSPATVGDLAKEVNTYWSGKVQMDYIASKDALLYAAISRGVKGAGFNGNLAGTTSIEDTPFRGEHMLDYEVGYKLTLLDRRLRLNGAFFYYDYTDFQTFQLGPQNNPIVSNNDAKFSGGELEIETYPVDGLQIRIAGSHILSTVYGVHTAQIGTVDQKASDAPEWSANWLVNYRWHIGSGIASVLLSGDYVSSRYHSTDNAPAYLVHASSGHNARIGYAHGPWDFSVFANNFTNSVRETLSYDSSAIGGYIVRTYQPPRWWGANVRYTF